MNKLILVIFIFILVFKPQNLPSLFKEISKLFVNYNLLKNKLINFWNENIFQKLILEENNVKALQIDKLYLEKNKNKHNEK